MERKKWRKYSDTIRSNESWSMYLHWKDERTVGDSSEWPQLSSSPLSLPPPSPFLFWPCFFFRAGKSENIYRGNQYRSLRRGGEKSRWIGRVEGGGWRDNQAAVTRTFRQFDQQYAIILKLMASAFVKNIGPFPDGSPSRETRTAGALPKKRARARERERERERGGDRLGVGRCLRTYVRTYIRTRARAREKDEAWPPPLPLLLHHPHRLQGCVMKRASRKERAAARPSGWIEREW